MIPYHFLCKMNSRSFLLLKKTKHERKTETYLNKISFCGVAVKNITSINKKQSPINNVAFLQSRSHNPKLASAFKLNLEEFILVMFTKTEEFGNGTIPLWNCLALSFIISMLVILVELCRLNGAPVMQRH